MDSIFKIRKLGIFEIEFIRDIQIKCREANNNYISLHNKEANKERVKASHFTSKKDIREEVFKKYGEVCLCCGSKTNISIDHVIPVHKGGENTISNLQPLCKSCNSAKGVKIIDYRKCNISLPDDIKNNNH
ncbi:MAG: hypothetical protein GF317_23265 [Candidatus Lokiarchaeota archaeon]|nr:hypothetical protein [Candidatus Lokiarchaeota archaeon]